MFKTCYLHIGGQKTGSTSIQHTCASNAALLEEQGICYPTLTANHYPLAIHLREDSSRVRAFLQQGGTTGERRRRRRQLEENTAAVMGRYAPRIEACKEAGDKRGARVLAQQQRAEVGALKTAYRSEEMATPKKRTLKEARAEYLEALEAEMAKSNAPSLLLSSELFFVLNKPEISQLIDEVRKYAETIKVICYVRHPAALLLSRLQQSLKGGESVLEDFSAEEFVYPSNERLESYAAVVGGENVIFRPFERNQMHEGDAIRDILKIVGVSQEGIDAVTYDNRNESMSREAILMLSALTAATRGDKKSVVRDPQLVAAMHRIGGTKFTVTPEQSEEIFKATQPETDQLAKRFGLTFKEPRFPEETPMWGKTFQADVGVLIQDLVTELYEAKKEIRNLKREAKVST